MDVLQPTAVLPISWVVSCLFTNLHQNKRLTGNHLYFSNSLSRSFSVCFPQLFPFKSKCLQIWLLKWHRKSPQFLKCCTERAASIRFLSWQWQFERWSLVALFSLLAFLGYGWLSALVGPHSSRDEVECTVHSGPEDVRLFMLQEPGRSVPTFEVARASAYFALPPPTMNHPFCSAQSWA